jgi:transposase
VYYIGLDVHKKTISYSVKDASGQVHQEGKIGATRRELDSWTETLPQPRTVAMEAKIFTGWIYDHLLPHEQVKVAHPLMLRAIAVLPALQTFFCVFPLEHLAAHLHAARYELSVKRD